jgi:Flp pilus assembly protein TadG
MRARLSPFVRACRGVAIIEFAVALPFFLLLVLGGLELANFCLMQQRVSHMASSVAMNAARGSEQIDEANVRQIMIGSELAAAGTPIMTNGRVVLSSVRLNAAKNGQWIDWQRCTGLKSPNSAYGIQDTGKSDTKLQAVGGNPGIKAPDGVNIMVAEVFYSYQPLIGGGFTGFLGGKRLGAVSAHVVRDRTAFGIKNDGKLPAAQLKTC